MERVQANGRVRAALGDRPGDPRGVVAGHQLDLFAAVVAEQIQELLDGLAVPASVRPDQPAGVMVDDDREIPLPFANGDLVEPEPRDTCEQVAAVALLGHHSLADPSDRPPADPHQLADRLLRRVHCQPGALIFEAAGEPRVVPRPGHQRDHDPVLLARDPRGVGLKEAERRPEIQRPPAPPALSQVIARATAPTMRAAIPLREARAHRDHDRPVRRQLDRLHDRLAQAQKPGPYPLVAHAATAPLPGSECQKPEP